MYTVTSQLVVGKYSSLLLDRQVEERNYNAVLCNGKVYSIVPSYDGRDIAIASHDDLYGKNIDLVQVAEDAKA